MAQTRIRWSEAEWDQVFKAYWTEWMKNPNRPMMTIANLVSARVLPKGRQRTLSTHQLGPLIERIQKLMKGVSKDTQELEAKVADLESKLVASEGELRRAIPREEVLQGLTDQELLPFSGRILDLLTPSDILKRYPAEDFLDAVETGELLSMVVTRLYEEFRPVRDSLGSSGIPLGVLRSALEKVLEGKPDPLMSRKDSSPPQRERKVELPTVYVGPLKGDQPLQLAQSRVACEWKFWYHGRPAEGIPSGCDYYVVLASFVSHSSRDRVRSVAPAGAFYQHHGGFTKLVEHLRGRYGSLQDR